MATATISRDTTSVTFDLYEEGGNLLVARDVGKPTAGTQPVGREDPRSSDHKSAIDGFTVVGQLVGSSAHADAKTLAEDLVKPYSDGVALELDLSAIPSLGTYEISVSSDRALQLGYEPGRVDWVSLQLTVSVVGSTVG